MSKFWLVDQHDGGGPSALVETDSRLQITNVLRFGPALTELDDQQAIWDKVIGKVAPTLKPCVSVSSIDEQGIAPHPELRRGGDGDPGSPSRSSRRNAARGQGSAGRVGGGPMRRGGRGER